MFVEALEGTTGTEPIKPFFPSTVPLHLVGSLMTNPNTHWTARTAAPRFCTNGAWLVRGRSALAIAFRSKIGTHVIDSTLTASQRAQARNNVSFIVGAHNFCLLSSPADSFNQPQTAQSISQQQLFQHESVAMASRIFAPAVRSTMRVAPRSVTMTPRRFLNTETAPSLYAARAKVVGARVGYFILPPFVHTTTDRYTKPR